MCQQTVIQTAENKVEKTKFRHHFGKNVVLYNIAMYFYFELKKKRKREHGSRKLKC
jgi:hypothetical protein